MLLHTSFGKLFDIIQELEVALILAQKASSDFSARIFSRHVIIRALDFVQHSRRLRRPLAAAGINVRRFHREKEIYADYFQEYFRVTRDRLSGHVQDIDFIERIDLWNDIELNKLQFFADSARDMYINTIGNMGVSEYVPYQCPIEVHDQNIDMHPLRKKR